MLASQFLFSCIFSMPSVNNIQNNLYATCMQPACSRNFVKKSTLFSPPSQLENLKLYLYFITLSPSICPCCKCLMQVCSARHKACRENQKYYLLFLQQRGSLMSEWVIPFEELEIAWSPLGSGRFGKVYR